jgi:hypothetical protein
MVSTQQALERIFLIVVETKSARQGHEVGAKKILLPLLSPKVQLH